MKRIIIIASASLGLAIIIILLSVINRPKLLWYVDEGYSAAWNRILNDNPPPLPRFARNEVIARPAGAPFPPKRFGFIITRSGPEGERLDGVPVALFPELARTRQREDWFALALDPWMVFRKHQDPEPGRSFLDNTNERGSILLAGSDQDAIQAWLCQLMQERPGVFTGGAEVWEEKTRLLVREYPFQSGAFSYSWIQTWPLLFRSEAACLYAPLSQARSLPPYRAGLLDATRFPEPPGWDRYGIQAEVLWAKAQGSEKQLENLAAVERWLRDARTQTTVANALEWIPAHPQGTAYNTVSWASQMAWLRSSYIWQGADDAQDS
ncbi:MAG: hypothetical protein FWG46_05640 [Treponema sp.]|nr:hypothetical protein [Treponema sp.]